MKDALGKLWPWVSFKSHHRDYFGEDTYLLVRIRQLGISGSLGYVANRLSAAGITVEDLNKLISIKEKLKKFNTEGILYRVFNKGRSAMFLLETEQAKIEDELKVKYETYKINSTNEWLASMKDDCNE
ncbi:MAG: hypothetical protein ACRCUJ_04210 [Phocaeicola sp.]